MSVFLGNSINAEGRDSEFDLLGFVSFGQALAEISRFGEVALRAWTNLIKQDWRSAINDLNSLIAVEPDAAFLYLMRGYAYTFLGRFVEAETDLNNAIRLEPEKAFMHGYRGFIHLMKGDPRTAISDFDHAIALNKKFQPAYTGRGIARVAIEQYDEAIKDLSEAIKNKQSLPLVLGARGTAYAHLGNLHAALADFEQITRLSPDHVIALNNQAFILFQLGQIEQAESVWHKAANLTDNLAFVHAGYSVNLWSLGKRAQAATELQNAIRLDSRWRDDLFEVATEYHWTLPMIEVASQILQYMVVTSLQSGKYPRITSDPERLSGFPTIRGMRLSVETVARLALRGASEQEILKSYPELEPEDIQQAVAYAKENSLLVDIAA